MDLVQGVDIATPPSRSREDRDRPRPPSARPPAPPEHQLRVIERPACRQPPLARRHPWGATGSPRSTARILGQMSWATLGRPARLWRLVHASWSGVQLVGLGYIWTCALTGRRNRRLWASVAFLLAEGAALVVGRGDCPVGPRQAAWGDPVPFFELVLPPRAAKAAIPVLAAVSGSAIAALVLRPPGLVARAGGPARASDGQMLVAPPAGVEPATNRVETGRSIH